MLPVEPLSIYALAGARSIDEKYLEQALATFSSIEISLLQEDVGDFQLGLPRSSRIINVLQCARSFADADAKAELAGLAA